MNADRLLALYEKIAEAPDAVPRLRRFVLDLAVRGKLVPQDAGDEPVPHCLKRSEAASELASDLPANWVCVPLGKVLELKYGKGMKASERLDEGPVPVFGSNGVVGYTTNPLAKGPAIIIGRKGSAGALNLCDGPSWTTDVAYYVEAPSFLDLQYLFLALETLELDALGKGVKPGLSRADAYPLPLGIPPLAEQRRIVGKVEELMALLDRLEAARQQREATRDRLTAASLARLTASDSGPDADPAGALPAEVGTGSASGNATTKASFPANARFALANVPALTTRPDQIKPLRQTILNLAVRGKLVDQDPADEPADLHQLCEADCPESLPHGWRYGRLAHFLAENTRNGYSRRPDDAENGVPILRISAGTVRQDGMVAEEEHKLISGIDDATRLQYGLQRGDLLACRFNGNRAFVGRLTLFDDYLRLNPIYPDKLIRVRLDRQVALPEFIRLAGESDLVRESIEGFCATTVGNWGISASNLKEVPFPLPPLAEQHRIVAKVDALMALCDRLEAALTTTDTTRARLLEALLHEALDPAAEAVTEAAE